MSIPYIGYTTVEDTIYQNSRKFILSKENPFYFEGKAAMRKNEKMVEQGLFLLHHFALLADWADHE
ncbi:glycoside hydrolase family 125 protein [Paenibacillus sp. MER TA 81-3]|nr:glycoside hydrolase family 125 protein [Paenibacillus sp. MER TA 81-3]